MRPVTDDTDVRRPSGGRLMRIARGFANPATRGRYAGAARQRIRAAVAPTAHCLICAAKVRTVAIRQDTAATRAGAPGRTFHMCVCSACGFVANPENQFDYRTYGHIEEMSDAARTGTSEQRGREFHMAQMAIDILGRDGLDVLVYGAGRSLDNHHIAALPTVRHVAIADVMRLRDDAEFIDANLPPPRQFAVVVASEVIEHFLEPRVDLARLFAYVEPDGLLVCSTNLYDGGNVARHAYMFVPGHTSYWSIGSLDRVAAANGVAVDIRIPMVATGYAGPRKRYVLVARSAAVTDAIERYFSTRQYAPSDSPTADRDRCAVTRGG